jgi:hypothetical protein
VIHGSFISCHFIWFFIMRRLSPTPTIKSLLVVLSLAAIWMPCREPAQKNVGDSAPAESAEILIKFKPGTPADSIQALETRLGLEKIREISAIGVHVYRTTSRVSANQALRQSQTSPLVEYAEPNIKYKIPEKN